MTNIYYTAREGRRNANGHTITRGEVYRITGNALENIGEYVHQSGGAGIELSILNVCSNAGIDTNSGYFAKWREAINLIQL
jgi:hypothetical protein